MAPALANLRVAYLPLRFNLVSATLFVAFLVFAFAGRLTVLMGAYLLLAFVVLLANVRTFSSANQRERNTATAFAVVLAVMLPISLLKSETALIHFVVVFLSMGVAFVLTRDVDVYLEASRITLLAAQTYTCIYLVRHGIANFPLQDMIPDSSSNGVTSYMVLLQANYCVVTYARRRRTALLTALVTLGICIVGFGRGSIVAAAGIVALGLFSKVWTGGRGRAAGVAVGLALVSIFVWARYGDMISKFVEANTKIGAGFVDYHRLGILSEYTGAFDSLTVWTGASYEGTSIVAEYNGNPHNSFIRAHYIFGLPYLALILLVPAYLLNRRHPLSVKLYSAGILAIVLFRAFTEPILFPTLFDFFYFGACFALCREPVSPLMPGTIRK